MKLGRIKLKNTKYGDPKYPTNLEWEMFDPETSKPPEKVTLLVLTEGGILLKQPWYEGARAWAYLPVVPKSVKERHNTGDLTKGTLDEMALSQQS